MKGVTTVFAFALMNLFALTACSNRQYASTNKVYKKQVKALTKSLRSAPPKDSIEMAFWAGTIHFGLRKPNFVVIHHTAQNSCSETLTTFTTKERQVSAHYVICRDGTIHHMLNDFLRAFHGGISKWGNATDLNSSSIGIEIDNNGTEEFTPPQIASLLTLLGNLKRAYAIPVANFIGHSDIAPTRKVDPSVHFPWKQLADSGYGNWWTDTTGIFVPSDFNSLQALRIIGYDIKDSGAAISAFKRKFEGIDKSPILNEEDKKVLYALYKKYE